MNGQGAEIVGIAALSLKVALLATVIACAAGIPFGVWLGCTAFRGRRTTLAPAAAATVWIASGSAEPSSTTMTRDGPGISGASPARQRASSACRSRTGMTTVTSGRSA